MTTAAGDARLQGACILLVEDDADSREVLADTLRFSGATVLEANGGELAFAILVRERPDLVLSDLRMPRGDGYELVQRIRRLDPPSGGLTPAVAMSASENMRAAILAGYHAFVAKPVAPDRVVEVVQDFVAPESEPEAAPAWALARGAGDALTVTLRGHLRRSDVRRMVAAVAVHLESAPCDVVLDQRDLSSFAPSVGSIAERGVWDLRHRIRGVHVVGGSIAARLVVAGACLVLGIPCTFASSQGGASTAQP